MSAPSPARIDALCVVVLPVEVEVEVVCREKQCWEMAYSDCRLLEGFATENLCEETVVVGAAGRTASLQSSGENDGGYNDGFTSGEATEACGEHSSEEMLETRPLAHECGATMQDTSSGSGMDSAGRLGEATLAAGHLSTLVALTKTRPWEVTL